MSTLSLLNSRSKDSKASSRINRNSKLFKTILRAIQEKKGEHIVSLDLRKIPEAVSDFFIICEATSTTQVKAIADNIVDKIKEETGEYPYHKEGFKTLEWVVLDYIDIVVHIFRTENRKFYQLEELWLDAELKEFE